jgi:hypothetical protein
METFLRDVRYAVAIMRVAHRVAVARRRRAEDAVRREVDSALAAFERTTHRTP